MLPFALAALSVRPGLQNMGYTTTDGSPFWQESPTSYLKASGRTLKLGLSPASINPWFIRPDDCVPPEAPPFNGTANFPDCKYSGYAVDYWHLLAQQVGAVGTTFTDWESLNNVEHTYLQDGSCLWSRACDAIVYDHTFAQTYQWSGPYFSTFGELADPAVHRGAQLQYVRDYNSFWNSSRVIPGGEQGLPTQGLAVVAPHYTDSYVGTEGRARTRLRHRRAVTCLRPFGSIGVVMQTRQRNSALTLALKPFSTGLWLAVAAFLAVCPIAPRHPAPRRRWTTVSEPPRSFLVGGGAPPPHHRRAQPASRGPARGSSRAPRCIRARALPEHGFVHGGHITRPLHLMCIYRLKATATR